MKVVLITLAVICGLGFLACAGTGIALFVWVRQNAANIVVADPVKIRAVTSEMADITIPSEFVPQQAMSLFGMSNVTYRWCPTGTCPQEESSSLTLMSLGSMSDNSTASEESEDHHNLKLRFVDFTKEEREFEIRGKKCKFTFALGDTRIGFDEEMSDDEMPTQPDSVPVPPARTATPETRPDSPDAPTGSVPGASDGPPPAPTEPVSADAKQAAAVEKGPKMWWVHGQFPGKKGNCTLQLSLTPEQYDEEKILGMIRSIR